MKRRHIPDWAKLERFIDMVWIADNLDSLCTVAKERHAVQGRGAVVINTTQFLPFKGHPMTYLTLPDAEAETRRIVSQYRPEKEIVVVLVKWGKRRSVYRVQARL